MTKQELQERLSELAEPSYRSFQLKLQISQGPIYGVRTPKLQKLAKQLIQEEGVQTLKMLLSHKSLSYEETIILYKLFGQLSFSTEKRLSYLPSMLVYNQSWATNDCLASEMKWITKDKEIYFPYFCTLLGHEKPYDKRLGIITLMLYYLEDTTLDEVLKRLSSVASDHYYVMMALAWAYTSAFCKYRERTLEYLQPGILAEPVRKKAIQKCIESRLVHEEDKQLLKRLRKAP
ncbi:MAG: DNA alkylation repair protein [Sphaerochaetaceae bacterium]